MVAFRRASQEQVNVFEVDRTYLFKQYFEGENVFARFKQYYNNQYYRFEVPPDDFDSVRAFLDEHGYGLVLDGVPEEFAVVVRKYTAHPENIFKASVLQRSINEYNCFLLTDQTAVDQAVMQGATRLTETNFETPF